MKRAHKGSIASEDMIIQLRQKELEYAQARARLDDLFDNNKVKEQIFTQNQAYQTSLLNDLKQL